MTDQSEYATVIVHCTDGATREMRVFAPHGHPLTPLTPEELHGKFLACAHGVIAPAAIDAALASLAALESLDDITTLTALLTRNSSSQSL